MNAPASRRITPTLAIVFAAYVTARVLEIAPSHIPRIAIVALDVLSALTFALVDGTRTLGIRGILIFAAICIFVGNIIENLGVATGFPFGHYYFAELMGPKLFHVPVLLGLAYIGMAYVSWTMGGLVAGKWATRSLLAVPLTASFIMVAWDLAQDPVWATILHGWVWRDGGPWFGVPISNYLGWYLNVFLIYLCFAFYQSHRLPQAIPANSASGSAAIIFYALCAAGNICQVFGRPVSPIVQDPTSQAWRAADITAASALVSIFVMGSFAVLAWIRMSRHQQVATN